MASVSCAHCGTPTSGAKYCSATCGNRYRYEQTRRTAPPCSMQGCNKPIQGRQLCGPHYAEWHRAQRRYEITCAGCGVKANVPRKPRSERAYCTRECSSRTNAAIANAARVVQMSNTRAARSPLTSTCVRCGSQFKGSRKYCTDTCRAVAMNAMARANRGPLRAAVEDGNHEGVIAAVESRSVATPSGCWIWSGRLRDGYPVTMLGAKELPIHRAVLEAKVQAPLGGQAAHHMCGDSRCVNPDHLQPVTNRDNAAEMLSRHAYVKRIDELEQALAALDRTHPLLSHHPTAGTARAAA